MAIDYDSPSDAIDVNSRSNHAHLPAESPPDRTQLAGDVVDKSSQFGTLQQMNRFMDDMSSATGVKRPSTKDTPATLIKLPTIKNRN